MKSVFMLTTLMLAACDNDENATAPTGDANDPRLTAGGPPDGGLQGAPPPMGRPDRTEGGADGRSGRRGENNFRVDPSNPDSATIENLVATVAGDAKHKDLKGTVSFHAQGSKLLVDAIVDGLPAGEHGYHVHVFGDCSALDAKSPGEHLDFHAGMRPMGSETGSAAMGSDGGTTAGTLAGTGAGSGVGTGAGSGSGSGVPKSMDAMNEGDDGATDMAMNGSHVMGNLGVLKADQGGHATASMPVDAHLRQLLGRAVVIHEKGNDDSKPDGAAGNPIACGVIGIANPEGKPSATLETQPVK